MTPEIRPIPGLPDYGASKDGRIWRITSYSIRSGQRASRETPYELRQSNVGGGNLAVSMPRPGPRGFTKRTVAGLVARTWLPRPIGNSWRAFQKDTRAGYAASNLEWR